MISQHPTHVRRRRIAAVSVFVLVIALVITASSLTLSRSRNHDATLAWGNVYELRDYLYEELHVCEYARPQDGETLECFTSYPPASNEAPSIVIHVAEHAELRGEDSPLSIPAKSTQAGSNWRVWSYTDLHTKMLLRALKNAS